MCRNNEELKDMLNFSGKDNLSSLFSNLNSKNYYNNLLFLYQKINLKSLLLRLDSMTMGHGVEARVPFLDHRIIEFANSMPLKYKLPYNNAFCKGKSLFKSSNYISERFDTPKYLLKKIFENKLGNSITHRKKMGFPVPINDWMYKNLPQVKSVLLDSSSLNKNIFKKNKLENFIKYYENNKIDRKTEQKLWMLYNIELWNNIYFK